MAYSPGDPAVRSCAAACAASSARVQTFALFPNDVAAVPAWTWHQIIAADDDLILFRVTDRPIHDAVGLFRAEETDSPDSARNR